MSDHKPKLLTKEELNRNLDIVDDYLCDECLWEDGSGALENVKNHINTQAELLERAVFEIGFNPECHCEPSTNHICNSCQLVREINAALGKGET